MQRTLILVGLILVAAVLVVGVVISDSGGSSIDKPGISSTDRHYPENNAAR